MGIFFEAQYLATIHLKDKIDRLIIASNIWWGGAFSKQQQEGHKNSTRNPFDMGVAPIHD